MNISDDALKELFSKMHIQIMVADWETYEILYANEKMNAAYNVDYDPRGKRCWETYQKGQDGPCDFCPIEKLNKDTTQHIEWEIHNSATNRWFHNVSRVIHWSDGRLAHFEQGVDITDIREKDTALREAEAYAQMMLDSTPLSCSIWNEEGELLHTNQETVRLFHLQDKAEYINDFFAFSPMLQPDGEPSREKAPRLVRKAIEIGFMQFEWEFKTKGNSRLPADIMLVRVPYKSGFRVLSYARDLRKVKESEAVFKQYTNLLHAGSDIAVSLLSVSSEDFDATLTEKLKVLGEAVGMNRVCVWENFTRDNVLYHRSLYRWATDEKWFGNLIPLHHELNYDMFPEHKELFLAFQTVNRRISDMSETEREFFTPLGVKAILMIPISYNNELWGFISFDNCVEETLTSDINVSVLKTNGILIASSITRNRVKKDLIASGHKLEMNGNLLGAVNHVAKNLLAGDPFDFTHVMQGCLEILGRSVGANRVSLWQNFEDGEGRLCSRRLPGWLEGQSFEQALENEVVIDFATFIPEWDTGVIVRKDINMPLRQMNMAIQNSDVMQNTKAMLLINIEINGEFWGFIAYSFSNEEQLFEKTEIGILRSGGIIIASAIMQNDINNKLLLATEEALSSVRAKNEFMARMSHEIRTPMNAVIGMTTVAQKSKDIQKINESLEMIATSSQQLLGLINNLLDMSDIDMSDPGILNVPYNFERMLKNTIEIFLRQIEEKGHQLHCDMTNLSGRMIIGDEKRTSKILSHLLSNAIKFTPAGGEITLRIQENVLEEDAALLSITVQDNGIGIREDILPRIFDPFEQAEGGSTRQYGGIGIGLPIVKSLATLMGGAVSVESKPGAGSSFSVTLSVMLGAVCSEYSEQTSPQDGFRTPVAETSPDWRGKRVLLVEDIEVNQIIALELLADTGVMVECAANGKQALEMFLAGADRYNLILMDMQMPVMDGLEATRQIRASGMPNARTIPIYAMTANAHKEDAEACMQAEMNGHITKPIDIAVLYRAMEKAFTSRDFC